MKRLSKTLTLAIALSALAPSIALAAGVAPSARAARLVGTQQHQAKVPIDEARSKALRLVPGKVVSEELENEKGRWIYSFEIKPADEKRRLVKEVNLDADTGAVVSIDTENE